MKINLASAALIFFLLFIQCKEPEIEENSHPFMLYQYDQNSDTRWSSFENIHAKKGKGGMVNKGAKGSSNKPILAGQSVELLNVSGPGIINRIWLTISHWQINLLPFLKFEIYWDGNSKPAVSVPLGDFFCKGLAEKTIPFENVFFSDPEKKSFNCIIPMPFKKGARVVITNGSEKDLSYLFYDINIEKFKEIPENSMYFHAYWNRDTATALGVDFEILPKLKGKGRFLGTNITFRSNPIYGDLWWGEGEVKMYLDGDQDFPTLIGTGTEDYIGTAWGQGQYAHNYQGCLVADKENLEWSFYRFHVPDPVWFKEEIRVTIQQIGAGPKHKVIPLLTEHIPIIPVAFDLKGMNRMNLLDLKEVPDWNSDDIPDGGILFYRSDDLTATAYFYLNEPVSNLSN